MSRKPGAGDGSIEAAVTVDDRDRIDCTLRVPRKCRRLCSTQDRPVVFGVCLASEADRKDPVTAVVSGVATELPSSCNAAFGTTTYDNSSNTAASAPTLPPS